MNKKEKALVLQAKQDLETAIESLANDNFEAGELAVVNVKDALARMLGETPELES